MSYTATLADYAANLKYEDIPAEVIEQVKRLTLHVIGVSLAACATAQGRDAIALAKDMSGKEGDATIFGDGGKLPCGEAGFANGTLADILDWEDCSWTGHPSSGAIPAALAMGERIKASGKEYITSVVTGYEVYQRIAMAVQPSIAFRLKAGWGLTSWQIFAAAIPAAKLLGLNRDKMAQVIGIAGAMTPIVNGKVNISRSDMYHYEHGLRCRDGITAAFIADKGINSLYDMLDGEQGYWVTVTDSCDWDWMTKGLGKDYFIMETYLKHWPVNMWIQQYMDIMDVMIKEDKLRAEDVAEIIISPSLYGDERTTRMAYRPDGYPGMTDAEFSVPYCLAAMLQDPNPGPNWFTKEKLRDPGILSLAAKVKGAEPDIITAERFKVFQKGGYVEAKIEVITKAGRHIERSLHYPKGHRKNMFSPDEHKSLFRRAASFTLKPKRIEAAIDAIMNIPEIDNISRLTELLHN